MFQVWIDRQNLPHFDIPYMDCRHALLNRDSLYDFLVRTLYPIQCHLFSKNKIFEMWLHVVALLKLLMQIQAVEASLTPTRKENTPKRPSHLMTVVPQGAGNLERQRQEANPSKHVLKIHQRPELFSWKSKGWKVTTSKNPRP